MDGELQLTDWLLLDQSNPLRFEKEVLYADEFEKRGQDGVLEYRFKITPQILDHLALSVDEQIKNGVEIPYASRHKGWELAENRWGTIKGARRGQNTAGKDALFLDVEFANDDFKRSGLAANVSVGVPPLAYDGLGRKYTNPLRHLAATSAPVVPGLSTWQAIAASFESEDFVPIIGDLAMPFPPKDKKDQQNADQGGDQSGNQQSGDQKPDQPKGDGQPSGSQGQQKTNIWDQILGVLELVVPPDADDTAKGTAVLTALQMLKGKRQMASQQQQAQQAQQQFGQGKQQQQAGPGGGIQFSQSPLVIDTIVQNRELQLSQLVNAGAIDPNCAKELAKLYGSKEAVGLELSQGGDGAEFKQLLNILANNKPVAKSGRQEGTLPDNAIELGHDGKSGLQDVVAKRAKDACENEGICRTK